MKKHVSATITVKRILDPINMMVLALFVHLLKHIGKVNVCKHAHLEKNLFMESAYVLMNSKELEINVFLNASLVNNGTKMLVSVSLD